MSHAARWLSALAIILMLSRSIAAVQGLAADASMPVKVFILAGQSNMQGQGVVSMDHPELYNGGKGNLVWSMEHSASKDRMRHLRGADGKWVERDDVTIWYKQNDKVRQGKLTVGYTGYGGASHIGPELQFGHVVGDAFKEHVLLIKTAWGGKSLHVDFRPPSADGDTGPFYTQMVAEAHEALASLGDRQYELTGFVWMQGWNDMISKVATAEYADNLVLLARDIRGEFKSPKLPIVIGELGNMGEAKPDSGMQRFRDEQKRGAQRINHAAFVETRAFARDKDLSPNRGHGHHWFGNAESYFLIGDALGKAMVKLLEGNG
jgi:choline dehydrogenase-like flavoprotein